MKNDELSADADEEIKIEEVIADNDYL